MLRQEFDEQEQGERQVPSNDLRARIAKVSAKLAARSLVLYLLPQGCIDFTPA
jgi:hypothetical protein